MLESILVWFRRDLRDEDNVALAEATRRARRVFCVFIFDRAILDVLPSRTDRRVEFIHKSLQELDAALRLQGGALIVRYAQAIDEIPRLALELGVSAVFANRDYEPQAKLRDQLVASSLARHAIGFENFKDQALLDGAEVLTQSGRAFTVYTPYRKAWLKRLCEEDLASHSLVPGRLISPPVDSGVPMLETIGFQATDLRRTGVRPGMSGARQQTDDFRSRIAQYADLRDFPANNGGSGLSVHLRFGTVSIRALAAQAVSAGALSGAEGPATWLSELIWRDFYFMILDAFPRVAERAFRSEFDAIAWEQEVQAERHFAAWCAGETGYPLVDAAMRQLNQTGFMHNRLRMVAASFLTKDLGIDWRRGEAYFSWQLLDFDLAANNGGWQWAASTGCDAQPYFRIFNPVTQSERFDPEGFFIRRFLPELADVPKQYLHAPWRMGSIEQQACGTKIGKDYPAPLVDHADARRRALTRYAVVRRAPSC